MTAYEVPNFPPDHIAHQLGWRPCAGIALFNAAGKVFCGKRRPLNLPDDAPLWQLPQGGIDAGEAPLSAAFRELAEETGIRSAKLIYELPDWLRYDLPDALIGTALKGRFRGQKQKWFAMQFTGTDDEIDLAAHSQIEFDDWAWRSLDDCVADVIAFKKPIYQQLATRLAHLPAARPAPPHRTKARGSPQMDSALPLIDFAAFENGTSAQRARIAAEIGAACRSDGFFALANHGITAASIDAGFDMAQKFFDLPESEKAAIAIDRSACHRGWFGRGAEVLDKIGQPEGDRKEGLKIGRDLPPEHPRVKAGVPLHGPNQWPAESGKIAGFRAIMQTLYADCEKLSRQLMQAFALSLGLTPTHFDDWLSAPMATLGPLRYPPSEVAQDDGQDESLLSAGAHTDFGCLTLLFQHDAPGLEIQNAQGQWRPVPLMREHVVVNIGDMMQHWTGGQYASTVHRVVNRSAQTRHSIAYFFDPDPDTDLSPLPGCGSSDAPPRTALSHLLAKIGDSFDYMETP